MKSPFLCVFPGQGAQHVGMGRALAEAFPTARHVLDEAESHLALPLVRLCFEGPEDRLRLTEHAQPAILAVSVAAYRVLCEVTGVEPAAVAGHSLGEWSALVAAGAVSFGDAVAAVRERGRLMQHAVPDGEGAMAAVMGLSAEAVEALCVEAAEGQVLSPANLNGAGQVVVAGHVQAVMRLVALAGVRRARAQRLPVSAPFHCALMAPAAEGLARHLRAVTFHDPQIAVYTSVEARRVTGGDEIAALLVRQVTAPVRWEETMRALASLAPKAVVEVGPGRVLSGLARRMLPDVAVLAVGDPASMAEIREVLA